MSGQAVCLEMFFYARRGKELKKLQVGPEFCCPEFVPSPVVCAG